MQAFQQYRDKFKELSAHVSDSQLTAMDTEIEAYVQTCATRQRDKARTISATVPLQPLEIPCRPWQSVSMDLITALPGQGLATLLSLCLSVA